MPTFVSVNLNEPEEVNKGPTNMTGYSLSATGAETRHVGFLDGSDDPHGRIILVAPGTHVTSPGNLLQSFPNGLTIESPIGDGMLVANVDWEPAGGDPVSAPDQEDTIPEEDNE